MGFLEIDYGPFNSAETETRFWSAPKFDDLKGIST